MMQILFVLINSAERSQFVSVEIINSLMVPTYLSFLFFFGNVPFRIASLSGNFRNSMDNFIKSVIMAQGKMIVYV